MCVREREEEEEKKKLVKERMSKLEVGPGRSKGDGGI